MSTREESTGGATGAPAQKKKSNKLLLGCVGCGCITLLFGLGLAGAGIGAVAYWGIDELTDPEFYASFFPEPDQATTGDKDKDKDKPINPDKDKAIPPPKEKGPDIVDKPIVKPPPPMPMEKGPWKGHQAGIKALRFTNDGKFVVTAAGDMEDAAGKVVLAADNSVRFWNPADGTEVEQQRLAVFKEGLEVAALSPDGRYAAVAYPGKLVDGVWQKGSDHVIHVWDLQTKRELPPLVGHTKEVFCLAFKKNGAQLLSGSRDNTVRLWNVRDGSQQQLLLGHTGTVTGVAFDPKSDNHQAVSCSADATVRLWDLDEGKLIREFKGHKDIVWAVAFSEDGTQLLTGGGMKAGPQGYIDGDKDTEIRLWNVADATEIKRFKGHDKAVTCLAFSPDGRRILSGGADHTVRLWHAGTGKELAKFEGHTDIVRCVAFFPDGRHALSGGDDRTLRVWNLPLDVTDLVKKLDDPDVKVKQEAVRSLAAFGDEAKPAEPGLLKCLSVGDAAFKQEVLALLKKLGAAPGRDDVALLMQLANDKTFPEGRLFALDALALLGADAKPALPTLVPMLKENDVALKRKAIVVIGQIGPDARNLVYANLIGLLRDPDAETAKAASEALPKLGKPDKEQIEPLGRFLTDSNENVRKYALTALTDLGAEAEPALPQIRNMAKDDKLAELRKQALAALLKLQPKEKETLNALTAALKDADPGVGLQAVAALAEIGPAGGALSGMLQALDHKNEEVRKAADEAFGKAAFDKTHVKLLATVLSLNKSPKVRMRVLEALGKLGPDAADAAEEMGKVARDSQGEARIKALQAIAELGPAGKKAGPMLVEVMKDRDEKDTAVRLEAAIALAKMNAPETKLAMPLLVNGLLVKDPNDAAEKERQEKVYKVLIQIGEPAADPLANTLVPGGAFYMANVNTPEGMTKQAARKKVLEALIELGPKANTVGVQRDLATVVKGDADLNLRKLADQARDAIRKKK